MIADDVKDSITELCKGKFVAPLVKQVNVETKPDKWDSKVIVLPSEGCRLLLFANKAPSKCELSLHYLELTGVKSISTNQLRLNYGEGKFIQLQSSSDAEVSARAIDDIIGQIFMSLKITFPHISYESLVGSIEVSPAERLNEISKKVSSTAVQSFDPCGGFSRIYRCICDLFGYSAMEEIVWDIDTIYLSHDSKTLYLRDFDHLSARDHIPLISALKYSNWFTGVDACKMKLTQEASSEILKVVKRNAHITTWDLSHTGIKGDFLQKLSSVIMYNKNSKIVNLNLSGNILEDKGITYIAETIGKMSHGLQSLDLSKTSMTFKGFTKLMESINQNSHMANTLHTLNLSGNALKGEEPLALQSFVAQPNILQNLDLSDTDIALDSLFNALVRGSLTHLEDLNVAGNPFTHKKTKEAPPTSWKLFFSSALVLKKINLSNTKIHPTAIKELLLGLSCNVNKPSVSVNLSCNDMKSEGGRILGSCIANLQNVHGLDLSDNGLDTDLVDILPWFGKNGSIHYLAIGKNFSMLRNRALTMALEALVSAIQDQNCALESLSLADSKLRLETTVVINALGSNSTIKSLDISGNHMGDIGAKMLAKALTINSTITEVIWDRNNVTSVGLRDVAQSLERNYSVLNMPLPVFDIAACSTVKPDVIQSSCNQIQTSLQRNHRPLEIGYDQSYRLQQGFLVSSTQNIIDKRIKDIHTSMSKLCELDRLSPEEFNDIKADLTDADKAKQILVSLQMVAKKCEAAPNMFYESVEEVISLLSSSVHAQLKGTSSEMIDKALNECPKIVDEVLRKSLTEGVKQRYSVGEDAIRSMVKQHLGAQLQNKINQQDFNVACYIAEAVIDEILESLNKQYARLSAMLTDGGGESKHAVDAVPSLSVLKLDLNRLSVLNTVRRRPQSILGLLEPTNEMSSENPAIEENEDDETDGKHLNDIIKKKHEETEVKVVVTEDGPVGELPKVEQVGLKHLVKDRPRRPKTKAVTRPITTFGDLDNDLGEIDDQFFKPAAVSSTPVITNPVAKPRTQSVKSDKSDKSDKQEKVPEKHVEPPPKPAKSSIKEKQEGDKKKSKKLSRSSIASGIQNFFGKKKTKSTDKPADQTDSVEDTQSKLETDKQETVVETAETPHSTSKPKLVSDGSEERNDRDSRKSDTSVKQVENDSETPTDEIKPPKKVIGVGVGMGMNSNLLAEMKAKRTTMLPPAQPKPATRAKPDDAPPLKPPPPKSNEIKQEEPAKPLASKTNEVKLEEPASKTPPARPTAAPRDSGSSTSPVPAAKPAPPTLRPKPPPKLPKPSQAPQRPITMDVSDLSGATHKEARKPPARPSPPNLSARLSKCETKLAAESIKESVDLNQTPCALVDDKKNPCDGEGSATQADHFVELSSSFSDSFTSETDQGHSSDTPVVSHDAEESHLKTSASHGDITTIEEASAEPPPDASVDNTKTKDKPSEEKPSISNRDSASVKEAQSTLRLSSGSNGCVNDEETISAVVGKTELGPVLKPPTKPAAPATPTQPETLTLVPNVGQSDVDEEDGDESMV